MLASRTLVLLAQLVLIACQADGAVARAGRGDSIACRDVFARIAELRKPLAARPKDEALLVSLLQAYDDLCLGPCADAAGGYGPWLAYARRTREVLAQVRANKPAVTAAKALPDWWLSWIEGDSVGVRAAIAAMPHAADDRAVAPLLALSANDPSLTRAEDGPRGRFAVLLTAIESGSPLAGSIDDSEPGLDPWTVQVARLEMRGSYRIEDGLQVGRRFLADLVWLLEEPGITDAVAITRLRGLAAALHVRNDDKQPRQALAKAIESSIEGLQEFSPELLGTALNTIDACLDGTRGWDLRGPTLLLGSADVAEWLRDRALQSLWAIRMTMRIDDGRFIREFAGKLEASAPTSIVAKRMRIVQYADPAGASPALASALAADVDGATPHSPYVTATCASVLRDAASAAAAVSRLVAKRGEQEYRGLINLARAASRGRTLAVLEVVLARAHRRRPMDLELTWWYGRAHRESLLTLAGAKPAKTWTDARIDNENLPWPGLGARERFAVRWRGWLRTDAAGSYRVAVAADDAAHLRIGGCDIWADDARYMQAHAGTSEFTAGWQPLELEFAQNGGRAGCRLTWRPPGAVGDAVIPPEALAHGESHEPGLEAEGWSWGTDGGFERACLVTLPEAFIAGARAYPKHQRWCEVACRELVRFHRYQEAAEFAHGVADAGSSIDHLNNSGIGKVALRALLHEPTLDRRRILALLPTVEFEVVPLTAMVFEDGSLLPQPSFEDRLAGPDHCDLLTKLESAGYVRETLALLEQQHGGNAPAFRALLELEGGDLARAHRDLGCLIAVPDEVIPSYRRGLALLESGILERMFAQREPDWAAISRVIKPMKNRDLDACLAWLTGEASFDAARALAGEDADVLLFVRGMQDLAAGDHVHAQADFRRVIEAHPDWTESDLSRCRLDWYAKQDPAVLAKLPKAARPAALAGAPPGNDF